MPHAGGALTPYFCPPGRSNLASDSNAAGRGRSCGRQAADDQTQYRLVDAAGGTYFFTVNLAERRSDILVRHIDDLRATMKTVKDAHPLAILAMVVLPEHLHAIWRLPPNDVDYSLRWSLIKAGFSRRLAKGEHIRASRLAKRERGIWQRRYWEH